MFRERRASTVAHQAARMVAGPRQRLADMSRLVSQASAEVLHDRDGALALSAAARATLLLGIEELQVAARGIHPLGRDLHDGAQQRFVSLLITLQLAERLIGRDELREGEAILHEALDVVAAGMEELTQLAGGNHPDALREQGLAAALQALADRSAVNVELDVAGLRPTDEAVEAATYFVVSEALTNTLKHARVEHARVVVRQRRDALLVVVSDDGRGGAEIHAGSGLRGLADRVQALGGRLHLTSPHGGGTVLTALLPAPSR